MPKFIKMNSFTYLFFLLFFIHNLSLFETLSRFFSFIFLRPRLVFRLENFRYSIVSYFFLYSKNIAEKSNKITIESLEETCNVEENVAKSRSKSNV